MVTINTVNTYKTHGKCLVGTKGYVTVHFWIILNMYVAVTYSHYVFSDFFLIFITKMHVSV